MMIELPIPGYDSFTVSIAWENCPRRKMPKRLIPRRVRSYPPGPEGWGNCELTTYRWLFLRVDTFIL